MPAALPVGDPVPPDGALPPSATEGLQGADLGIYLHVPFCRVRCGYCDFNTYTPAELSGSGASTHSYLEAVHAEVAMAGRVLSTGTDGPSAVGTIFIGGGTPTLLEAAQLAGVLHEITELWPLRPGAEVTVEANPDTITPSYAAALAAAGVNRVSIGMQSAVESVLATLDRTHDPANVTTAVRAVHGAGMQVSLDLIYGTPGESLAHWRHSLQTAIDLEPDHISAYALIVEEGTRMAAQVRRGQLPAPDPDDQADKYEMTDELLAAAGFDWYEISNWATAPEHRCRHNEGYWNSVPWWGLGPGAHSHVGGVRWWNVKHPAAYAARLADGRSPGAGREVLTAAQQHQERVLLLLRTSDGLPVTTLAPGAHRQQAVAGLIHDGLVEPRAALAGRLVLTLRGRLLADSVVHRLLP